MKIFLDAYIARNLGDDLFLDVLFKRYPNHTFFAFTNGYSNYDYPNFKVCSNKLIYKIVKKLRIEKYIANFFDLVVTIGGSMFMERGKQNYDLTLGNKDRYIIGVNFGPYNTKDYYDAAFRAFRECKDVCFREKYSYELFKDLPNTRYAPDIAFGLDKSELDITNRRRAIISVIQCDYKFQELKNGFEISESKYTNIYQDKITELIERLSVKEGYEVVLLSMCESQEDDEAVERIYSKCSRSAKEKMEKYFYKGNIEEVLDLFADSSLVVGSRLHANIIGMTLGKPIIPLAYSDKMKHIIEDLFEDKKDQMPYIYDIKYMDDFDINNITKDELERIIDITGFDEHKDEQFRELDKILL